MDVLFVVFFIPKPDQSNYCRLYLLTIFSGEGNQTWQQPRSTSGDDAVDIIHEKASTRGNIFSQCFSIRDATWLTIQETTQETNHFESRALPENFLFTRPGEEGSSLRLFYDYLLLDVSTLFFPVRGPIFISARKGKGKKRRKSHEVRS